MSDPEHKSEDREIREVVMSDPDLSERTNQLITADLRVAVGADSVSVPVDRPHIERGARSPLSGHILDVTDSRLLLIIIASMMIGVGAILAVTSGRWWFVPVALLLVAGLGLMIVTTVLKMTGIREHPAATTAAAMRADGIVSPDEFFSAAVAEFTERPDPEADGHRRTSVEEDPAMAAVAEFTERPDPAAEGHRSTAVEEDPAMAAAEQESAMTPSSGRSDAVGP